MQLANEHLQRKRWASIHARSNALIRVSYPRPRARGQSSSSASRRNITCRLRGTGSRPWRAMARANYSDVGSGVSPVSLRPTNLRSPGSHKNFEAK